MVPCTVFSLLDAHNLNLPNVLTIARIALVPVFALAYLGTENYHWIAAALFAAAAFTDWLDGYLARRLDQTTLFGAFLDPVADKLIVVTALVLLIGAHASLWVTIPSLVIIGREIVISALREWMAEMNRRGVVTVSWIARVKTTLQMVAIVVLFANPPALGRPWVVVGLVLLYAAAVITIWSMVIYLRGAWPTLKEGFNKSPQPGCARGNPSQVENGPA